MAEAISSASPVSGGGAALTDILADAINSVTVWPPKRQVNTRTLAWSRALALHSRHAQVTLNDGHGSRDRREIATWTPR